MQDGIATFKELLQKDAKAWHVRGILAKDYGNLADVLRRMGEEKAAEEAERQGRALALPPSTPADRKK